EGRTTSLPGGSQGTTLLHELSKPHGLSPFLGLQPGHGPVGLSVRGLGRRRGLVGAPKGRGIDAARSSWPCWWNAKAVSKSFCMAHYFFPDFSGADVRVEVGGVVDHERAFQTHHAGGVEQAAAVALPPFTRSPAHEPRTAVAPAGAYGR